MSNQLAIREDMPLSELGQTLVKSGFFADTRDAAQAVVKVLAGRELGIGPIASMTGINVIQGRISLSANLIGAAIKRSGRYNFRVRKMDPGECAIEFFEGGESIGVSTFTIEDARKAGTKNLDKFPRNMLYARAMSNGARWYCPDVFSGPIYTPEELGADVGEGGEPITVETRPVTHTEPTEPTEQPAAVQAAAELHATVSEQPAPLQTAPREPKQPEQPATRREPMVKSSQSGKSYPKSWVDKLVANGTATNPFNALGMLDIFNLPDGTRLDLVDLYSQEYRRARANTEHPATTEEAKAAADELFTAYLDGKTEEG